eukprot:9635982-Alexandrium_andersonii.AAC.1
MALVCSGHWYWRSPGHAHLQRAGKHAVTRGAHRTPMATCRSRRAGNQDAELARRMVVASRHWPPGLQRAK